MSLQSLTHACCLLLCKHPVTLHPLLTHNRGLLHHVDACLESLGRSLCSWTTVSCNRLAGPLTVTTSCQISAFHWESVTHTDPLPSLVHVPDLSGSAFMAQHSMSAQFSFLISEKLHQKKSLLKNHLHETVSGSVLLWKYKATVGRSSRTTHVTTASGLKIKLTLVVNSISLHDPFQQFSVISHNLPSTWLMIKFPSPWAL